ncbi:ArsR family transcriptional regulator [Nocardioides speluncae]|uniref:ArsR family transcriptional regulator n=1 Tax=Nocardioides speluncae TaxID=2670337 RepID=UPI000D695ED5|nr:ArsR family transcriptional regulator [Nocardioides speluncae]
MITVAVDHASLARLRLTASPVQEVVAWMRLTVVGRRHPVYGDPGPAARRALTHPDTALVASVMPPSGSGYAPDLLTPQPPPAPASRLLDEQLAAVAATPADQVHEQVGVCAAMGRPLPAETRAAVADGSFGRRAADGLRAFWQATLADGWAGLYGVLEADLATRSATLARGGAGALLGSLHRDLGWDGRRISIGLPYDEELALVDTDIVLAPTALGWPGLSVQVCSPDDAVLGYPALGVGDWARQPVADGTIAELLGLTRARLLGDLALPRTNAELSNRHDLAPATVSHHLGVLHRCGMVVRRRDGRTVLYQRSARGDDLVS